MTDLGISGIGDARLIASGGSALVYAAEDAEARPVAVKVLRGVRGAEVNRRFDREQQAAERLREHPNIIDVYRSGLSEAGEPFLVMPLMSRGSLADQLEEGPFELYRAIDDVSIAAEAIDFAHRRGVLHRDLKPGNLLRTDEGSVVVTDFGIARVLDAGITSATIGATTPLYAAPELLAENEASVQSDVYALGAVLYALLAGAPAFSDAANIWATISRIRSDAPPPIALVPAPVMRVIAQAMAKDPTDRPPTAHQFHLNLAAARHADDSWHPPSPAEVTSPAAPPGPASVPVVVVEQLEPEADPARAEVPRPPIFEPAFDAPIGASTGPPQSASMDTTTEVPPAPPVPVAARASTKVVASAAALALLGLLAWFGISRVFGSDSSDLDVADPIDTSLPSPEDRDPDPDPDPDGDDGRNSDDDGDGDGAGDAGGAPDDGGDLNDGRDALPTPTDRLVSFTGTYFSAFFPDDWAVVRRDIDVGYGFRSEFVGPGDMYLNVDTTPAELRTGTATIEASAREIAASISSAGTVTTEVIDDIALHSFTFRNDRGVESIDIFFEVDGDGYAVVAGSNDQPDAVFAIARQVALSIRSAP